MPSTPLRFPPTRVVLGAARSGISVSSRPTGTVFIVSSFMPPQKRKSESVDDGEVNALPPATKKATTKDKAKERKRTEPYTGEDGWTVHPPSLIYKTGRAKPCSKLACFDLDGTLVRVKSSSQFPRDENDWKFFNKKVPQVLKQYATEGYKLVIFSNQAGIRSALEGRNAQKTKKRIDNVIQKADVEMQVFLATEKDEFRKAEPGMWNFMLENCNGGLQPDKESSFYVGDAAGRDFDFDNTDKGFAERIGLTFRVPEDVFGEGEGKRKVNLAEVDTPEENINKELTRVFTELAEVHADDRFKKTAFQKVAMVISKFPKKITMENLKEVKQLPGVGKASLQKVEEFLTTGKVQALDDVRGGTSGKAEKDGAHAQESSMAMKFM